MSCLQFAQTIVISRQITFHNGLYDLALPHHDCDTIRSSGNEFLRKDASESDLMKLSKDSSDLSLLKSTQSDAFSGSMPAAFGLTKTNNDKHINSCASPRLQNNASSASVHTVPQENRIEPLTWRGGESRNQTPNFQITAPKNDGSNRTRIEKASIIIILLELQIYTLCS